MVTNPVSPADAEERQFSQSKQQQDQLESATQHYFHQTGGMPQSVMSEDERGVLANARARNEIFGEEMPDSSVALLEKAADEVEQDSFAYFSQQGRLPEDIADWASKTQKRIFLGDELPESEESKLEGVKLAAKDNRKQAEAEAMESDPRRKEYGRMIYGLKDEYTSQAGYHGDENLLEAAAKIRAGESVYDKQPTEKQGRLLRAADIQRKKGIGKQLKKDYKSAGVSPRVAEAAGDIKAQEFVFGTELSEKQQKRIDEADSQLTRVDGQLKRQQQLELAESQIPKAYQEGRLTQTLEDAGVPAELAGKAAKIEASSGGEPQNQEDADILSQAYASAGNSGQDASTPDAAITEAATNANQFLDSASSAGITEKMGDAEVAQGKNYNMTRTGSTTVVKNRETEATLVTQGDEVLASDGISDDDLKRLAKLGQLSPEQISESIGQSTQATEKSSQIETPRPSPKPKPNAKPNEVEI